MRRKYFDKFKGMKADGQAELEVRLDKPELVVISYEFINFLKLKDPNDFDKYWAFRDELKRIGWGDAAKGHREQVGGLLKQLYTVEYRHEPARVRMYTPLMYADFRGLDEYDPNGGNEREIARCLDYLHTRVMEDFEAIDLDALKEVIVFSGLHGEGNPIRLADSLADEFGLGKKVVVYSTGCHHNTSRGIARIVNRERYDVTGRITPMLQLPFVEAEWHPELLYSELMEMAK